MEDKEVSHESKLMKFAKLYKDAPQSSVVPTIATLLGKFFEPFHFYLDEQSKQADADLLQEATENGKALFTPSADAEKQLPKYCLACSSGREVLLQRSSMFCTPEKSKKLVPTSVRRQPVLVAQS